MSYEFSSFRYTDGQSDKAYEIEMTDAGGGQWTVNYAFGKYGSKLQGRHKVTGTLPVAHKAFQSLVAERVKKKYTLIGTVKTPPASPRIQVKGATTNAASTAASPTATAKAKSPAMPPRLDRMALTLNASPFLI